MRRKTTEKLLLITDVIFLVLIVGCGISYRWNQKYPRAIQWSTDKTRSLSPDWRKTGKYWETSQFHTLNLHEGKNEVKAVVLHHTASKETR